MTLTVGTGINTPPIQLVSTMNSITDKYILPELSDAILKPSPTLWLLTRQGEEIQGGEITYPIFFKEGTTGGAYTSGQILNVAPEDLTQPADQVWKPYYETVSLSGIDIAANSGPYGVLNLIDVAFAEASGSFLQKLSRAVYHATPQNTSSDIDDIYAWVKSTTNTIAGIDRSVAANAFWLPGAYTGQATIGSLTQGIMEQLYNAVVYGTDEPDAWFIENSVYPYFKNQFVSQVRFTNNDQDSEVLNAGFRMHFVYNNAVCMSDRNIPTAGDSFLVNTNYLYPLFHQNRYFTVDPWMKPVNQDQVSTTIYLMWNLINRSPRMSIYAGGITG